MASRFSVEAIFKAVDKFTAPVTQMQNRVGKFSRSMNRSLKSTNNVIDSVAGSLWGAGKTALVFGGVALGAVTAATVGVIEQFSKIEDARAAFTPLMGGAEKAAQLVDSLNILAAETPFRFNDIADAAKQLLPTMNGDIQKTVDTIKMLGDTAGGNAQKLDSITHGFTKAMLKGKVDLESLNMIGEAGVPIFTALADSMGKKVNPAFFKMISAGKVTTAQLTKAFEKMTSEGGMFFNGMDIASKTTSGMWSTLQDNVSMAAASLGEVLAPTVKELIQYLTDLAKKARDGIKANPSLIRKFTEYVDKAKAAFASLLEYFKNPERATAMLSQLTAAVLAIGTAIAYVVTHAETIGKAVEWVVVLTLAFKAFSAVMAIVNFVMIANPIGLTVLAIAGLVVALSGLVIWWDDLVSAMGRAYDGLKKFGRAIASGLGFGGADVNVNHTQDTPQTTTPQVVSPQERNARLVEESRSTSYAELLIRDSTGRAELSNRGSAPGVSFSMVPTGGF